MLICSRFVETLVMNIKRTEPMTRGEIATNVILLALSLGIMIAIGLLTFGLFH